MSLTTLVDNRPGPSGHRCPVVDRSGPPKKSADGADASDVVQPLASRLVAGLDNRPFYPTPDQLAWVWGGDLVPGETRHNRAPIAAARYAGLFTNHVVPDVTLDGAAGAYARIWLCARLAFTEIMVSESAELVAHG